MKARAERIAAKAVKAIMAGILEMREMSQQARKLMEDTHKTEELAQNLNYCALVSADNNLAQTLREIDNWINGKHNLNIKKLAK